MKQIFTLKSALLSVFALILSMNIFAQLQVNGSVTANALANQIVGSGVTISNVELDCAPGAYGTFTNGNTTNIGLVNGVLLTTGAAEDAIGPNDAGNTTVNNPDDYNGNASLDPLTPWSIRDACSLSFDFVANSNFITVQYVFGSEEYNEYVCSQFNDIFGFFVNGPKPAGGDYNNQNLAIVPSTLAMPVSVNSINNGSSGVYGDDEDCISLTHSAHYIDNSTGLTIGYDGFTIVLTAQVAVIPGETYSFEFAIADISDSNLDSGVFVKGSSFSVFLCQAGTISFDTPGSSANYCLNDDFSDVFSLQNNAVSESDFYTYLLTDNSGNILAINEAGDFNMALYGEGTFAFYGLSYSGVVSGISVGSNISDISVNPEEGCFELSNALWVNGEECTDLPILNCPENIQISCDAIVPQPNPSAIEVESSSCQCLNPVQWEGDVIEGNSCSYTITRTYSVTDNCGNTGTCSQIITVTDSEAPSIVEAPASEIWVECDADVPALEVTFSDNCDTDLVIEQISSISPADCGFDISRSITAIDDCGNEVSFSQSVHIRDTTAPTIEYVADNATILCSDDEPAVVDAIFGDNCSEELEIVFASSIEDLDCGYNIYRTWTATDACGNSTTASQIITVTDNQAPVIAPFTPYLGMACTEIDSYVGITATDNCSEVTITWVDQLNSGGCLGTLMRTYYATDACGNQSSAVQYISIYDNAGPVISNPENATVECDNAPTSIPTIEIYDECGFEVEILEASQTIVPLNECSYQIIWHWVAMDYCENISEATTVITVTDTTAPVVNSSYEEASFSCDAEYTAPEAPAAYDNCDEELTVTPSMEMIPGDCQQYYSLFYTWEYTDNCGNSVTAVIVHNFYDESAPVFAEDAIASISIECDQEIPFLQPSASDNCSDVTISFVDNVLISNDCYSLIERTFTATDACGNASDFVQTISIQDTTAPVFDAFEVEITMSCDNIQDTFVTATDNCNEVEITFTDELVSGGCQGRIIRTYYAMDACENVASTQQIITLVDETAPVIEIAPEDLTIECGTEVPAFIPVWSDNCDEELELAAASSIAYDNCSEIISRSWSAIDNCGNTTTVSQTITIVDTTLPEWEYVPASETVECDAIIPAVQMAYAYDVCDSNVDVTVEESTLLGNCANSYTIVRTYTATDDCGNSITAIQNIYIVDTTAPTFGEYPYQLSIECNEAIPYEAPMAFDNCGDVVVTFEDITSQSSSCYTLIERVFTATDACENQSQTSQWITIVDTTAPVFDAFEAEINMSCDNIQDTFVTATDNCNEVEITFTDELVSGGCQGRIIRTYYAMDACENVASAQQIITLVDETAPVIEIAPEDLTIECGTEVPAFIPVWSDNCDEELELAAASSSAYDNCSEIISRSWSAIDNCGNTTTVSQTITIVDTTLPEWEYVPVSETVECDAIIPAVQMAYAYDICDNDVDVIVEETIIDGECDNSYTIVRTYTATDDCGNSISAIQYIYVVDTTAPTFGEYPYQLSVECNEAIPYEAPMAFDNCGDVVVTFEDITSQSSSCYTLIERVFTATDACENQSQTSQWITIVDTTAPVFDAFEAEITMSCDNIQDTFVTATDNCNEVEITFTDELVSGGCQGRIIRTYYAMDACENVASTQQIITLVDETAPVIEIAPEDLTIECGTEVPAFIPVWSDNCDEELELTAASSIAYDNCSEIISRSWSAIDNCGNTTTVSQTITIVDTTLPEWEYVPASVTIECDAEVPAVEMAYAYDICDSNVEVTVEESTLLGNCANSYTIVRTYTATDDCGNSISAIQYIYVVDTTAPVFTYVPSNNSLSCSEFDGIPMATAEDACGTTEVTYTETAETYYEEGADANCGQFTSFSAGGWGAPNGTGANYRDANFAGAFPSGLTVGCDENTYTFTSALAIENFLPAGGTSTTITGETVNPTGVSNQLANQLVAASLSIGFDAYDMNFASSNNFLGDAIFNNGTFDGMTISEVVGYANNALGGCAQPYTLQQLASAMEVINLNYDGTGVNLGNFSCGSEPVCGTKFTRVFTATDACGNTATATTEYIVFDNVAPEFDSTFENVHVQCAGDIPAVMEATASDACSEVEVFTDVTVIESDDCGNQTIHVVYTAVDGCGNTATTGYYIYAEDTTEPTIDACPENIVLACDADIPAPAIVTATDNCDTEVEVMFEEYIVGDMPAEGSVADCNILTPALPSGNPCNYPTAWAMAMFNLPSQYKFYTVENGSFIQYPDGSIHVIAEMHSTSNSSNGWNVDVWFDGGMSWTEWSTQAFPTGFKADCGGVGADHEEWLYYLLQAGEGAELTGFGAFTGSSVNLVHAPANQYFGFQYGNGANNYNAAENGFGGWFTYGGYMQVDGVPYGQNQGNINGAGDFAFELDCCPDYSIVRQWTAMDCSGNTSSCVQTISFETASAPSNGGGNLEQQYKPSKGDAVSETVVAMSPNPAKEKVTFKFTATLNTKATIEVFDITGNFLGTVFNGKVEFGNEYITTFDVSHLPNGMYFVRTNNGLKITTTKLVVSK